MLLIKLLHDACHFHAGKNVGNKFSPSNIDRAVYEVLLDKFKEIYKTYAINDEVSHDLEPFKAGKSITIEGNTGTGDIEPEFEYRRIITTGDGETEVEYIEDGFWINAINDKIQPPSNEYPICTIDFDLVTEVRKLKARPKDISSVHFYYFRLPKKPVYGFTKGGPNNDRYIYDEDSSVDIEFNRFHYPDILNRTIKKLGINIRDEDLIMYAENQVAQNKG